MSRITLKPLDGGEKAVEIPVGNTIIGRGPFLQIRDKRVSRFHALLEVRSNGKVCLTPTHVKPIFYQPTADSPGQILKKDISLKLKNRDSFSFLPRAFRYQLVIIGENTEDKNDQNDLNKQSRKTNDANVDCKEALLNERITGTKSGKGISVKTVAEKPFSIVDEVLANIDKSYSEEENTFAKKFPVITIDEEESTFINDVSPEDKIETDHIQFDDECDSEVAQDTADEKSDNLSENKKDDKLDQELAKELEEGNYENKTLLNWVESEDMSPPKTGKKRGPEKSQAPENKTLKRKRGVDILVENFRELLHDNINSDVVLKTNDHVFHAHRLILSVRSPVFCSMFRHDMAEKKTGEVDISDCSTAGFKVFLQHLYTGNAESMSPINVLDVFYIADKYQVEDLKWDCVECMKNSLSVDNFCDIISLSLRHSVSDLQSVATQFFSKNLQKIIKSVPWQNFFIENPIQANKLFIKATNA